MTILNLPKHKRLIGRDLASEDAIFTIAYLPAQFTANGELKTPNGPAAEKMNQAEMGPRDWMGAKIPAYRPILMHIDQQTNRNNKAILKSKHRASRSARVRSTEYPDQVPCRTAY